MDNLLVQISIVVAIGICLFLVARISRRSHDKEYGAKPRSEKVRFSIVFIITLVVMLVITTIWPISRILLIGVVILSGLIGVLGSKPSLYKDIMYSATISSFVSIFTGWTVHGM